ncbi:aminoglycoside 3'-phosphotransferase [Devosia sp. XJ19-1]|uniref:Aminoglycoside 3'-phosphotransferase n=1 Tax=Devosia ureilytica TaxID=2952754 RepID=A0A9Q4FR75_9HYPH|nr:APH(3') family aminoglycoside O-phosphotransferase [Devosia ureilytica]MCP8882161.1 aminoglycoside 3'-phosphotransferase [Devosia ureilytica]MCP8885953.1 aminoglycoside 3'-phosphotransferase [Devosia ureilytica]
MTLHSDLPESMSPLRDLAWTPITIGKSGASVWRIALNDDNAVFLKTEPLHPLAELPGEIERLNWLTRMGFKAPRVVDAEQGSNRLWLLMSAVPGEDLTHYIDRPEVFVRAYAQGLKRMHALDTTTCHFDHGLDARLADAEARLVAGLVDESDFDTQRLGQTAQQVLDWLKANRPPIGQQIVTHGDASTPNVLALDGRFSGMVDCGRVGLADVWQDLALACRSVAFNIGEAHIPAFLAAYGAEWDEVKYRYYCTLDEMF